MKLNEKISKKISKKDDKASENLGEATEKTENVEFGRETIQYSTTYEVNGKLHKLYTTKEGQTYLVLV